MTADAPTGDPYVLRVPAGFEEIVARHAGTIPGVSGAEVLTEGAVELRHDSPPVRLASLRVSEGLYRRLGIFLSSPNLDEMMRNLVSQVDFRGWDRGPGAGSDRGFAVTAALDPALGIPPSDYRSEVTWALQALLRARPSPGGREIHVAAGAEAGWVGVSWGERPRDGAEGADPETPPRAVAAGAILHACTGPDDRVLDPCCGFGQLLTERALAGPSAAILGGDADAGAVRRARAGLAAVHLAARLCRWDFRRLPARDRSVDAVVTHLPSATRAGSRQIVRSAYRALLREVSRLLRVTGRGILLTAEGEVLADLLLRQPDLAVETRHPVCSGRFRAELFVVRPTLKLL
jgi:SAM-dependent methyltransferase